MVPTIKFKALKSGTEHDGTSMIVMNKGKVTEAPATAEEMLRSKEYFTGEARKGREAEDVGNPELAAALARAEAAEDLVAELQKVGPSASSFELEGFTFNTKGGGWFEITGPEGFDTIKEQGEADAKALYAQAVADKLNPPAAADVSEDGAPAA